MSAYLRHVSARAAALARDPLALFYLLVAAASSLFLWPVLLRHWPGLGGEELLMQALGLVLWPWLLSLAALVRTERSDMEPFPKEWPLPTLPVGPRVRLLGEVSVILLLVVLLRLPFYLAGEGGRDILAVAGPFFDGRPYGVRVLAATLQGALVSLPVLLAWSIPTRTKWWYFLRPLTVVALLFALIETDLLSRPALLPVLSLALSAAVLMTAGREPRGKGRPAPRAGSPARLFRPALEPEARFLRDRWSRPMRFFAAPVAFSFMALTLLLLLESRGLFSPYFEAGSLGSDFFKGGIVGGLIGLLPLPLLYPVGISLLKGVQGRRPGSLAPGGYAEAWSVLPVPPWKVARAIYEHALLGGLILWGLLMGYALLSYSIGTNSYRIVLYFLPLVLAVPCGAGLLVALAFGDSLRTALALGCLFLFVPLQLGAGFLMGLVSIEEEPRARVILCLALGLVLALAGSLPPLVHLRRRRSGAE